MSTMYSKIRKISKKPSGFFEEVKEENLRYAIKFLVVLSIIPAVSAAIITTAIQLLSITGIMDAFHVVMAFFIGVFAGICVYNSRYIDDVAEVRREKGEIDILLKNDDIIEAKNFDWSHWKPDEAIKILEDKIMKLNRAKAQEKLGDIEIVFKDEPPQEVINFLDGEISAGRIAGWEVL